MTTAVPLGADAAPSAGAPEPGAPGEPLSETVYRTLRDQIMSAQRPAGVALYERTLAIELEASRVPIREALQRLAARGLVTMQPRRAATIPFISSADVNDLYDLRLCVESGVAQLAARQVVRGANATHLRELVASADRALTEQRYDDFFRGGLDFHSALVTLSGNSLAETVLAPLSDRTERLNRISQFVANPTRNGEHAELAEAVIAGKGDLAAAVALTHIEHERERVLDRLPHHPHYSGQ